MTSLTSRRISQPNGKYRKIEILADNKKYKVRARKGYYAPRQ